MMSHTEAGTVEPNRDRRLIALAAVAVHLSIGSIYAYSIYQIPLEETQGRGT
jgi:OFA family oxalate/formate antiporter-like MFS transporter